MEKEIFVANVQALCKQQGIKPTIACTESGAGRNFLNDIKRGQTPSVSKVQLLATYLGVTTSELLGEVRPPPNPTSGSLPPEARHLWTAFSSASEKDKAIVKAALGL